MTPGSAPETVFGGDLLRARLWVPDRPTTALYVTFRQWLPDPGRFSDRGPVRRALTAGLAHLHIQTRWNDWFLNPETTGLEAALKAARGRFMTARALGFSMGGYAALRFSRVLRLNQVRSSRPRFRCASPAKTAIPRPQASTPGRASLRPMPGPT